MDVGVRQLGRILELTPEVMVLREVLAARASVQLEGEGRDRRRAEEDCLVEQIADALESSGVSLMIKPEDIKVVGPNSPRIDVESAGWLQGVAPDPPESGLPVMPS
ncbi:hypothetical protein ABZ814_21230 [Micromonospora musae]|uniref:hypothetical protein n=1 Tax=Micromonospora musae TaxID=1894970 RepID=UPI0033E4A797